MKMVCFREQCDIVVAHAQKWAAQSAHRARLLPSWRYLYLKESGIKEWRKQATAAKSRRRNAYEMTLKLRAKT